MQNQNQLKKDIITRLFKEGHINLDEVLVLMQKETEYIPQRVSPFPTPVSPTIVPNNPWNPFVGGPFPGTITYDVTNTNHPNNKNYTLTNAQD